MGKKFVIEKYFELIQDDFECEKDYFVEKFRIMKLHNNGSREEFLYNGNDYEYDTYKEASDHLKEAFVYDEDDYR